MSAARLVRGALLATAAGALAAPHARADPPIEIDRAAGLIHVDGDLSDPAWQKATRIETWYETNPGDNVEPKAKSTAWLTYDDRFFYAAFEFEDPHPERIRAPVGDRDSISGSIDYGGVILDTRNDGRTGILLLTTPHGVQYDAVTDDTTGNEDSSLNLFWDSAARVTDRGWVLEMRVPFSSLRYAKADPQTWGILLYRNWPREFRYQMFSSKLPRGGNCFVCNSRKLVGLRGLPAGSHGIVAPFVTATRNAHAGAGPDELVYDPVHGTAGVDAKWLPNANTAVDATVNPDFSQVESDTAQIGANERFALNYPEKRPFFLEGLELYSTPVPAVYTRSITSPRWGVRGTGKLGASAYTVFVTQDRGGGSVILPGPEDSGGADQDFRSTVALGRVRHDFGRSFASFLVTDREVQGGGYNRVFGPDFQYRPTAQTTVTGQFLLSRTENPVRPDLDPTFDGRKLASHAADVWASHSTPTVDVYGELKDFGDDFRADVGFVPQVGFREGYGEAGYTFRPQGFIRRLRSFAIGDRQVETGGALLSREWSFGTGMDAKWNSFARFRYANDRVRSGGRVIPRQQLLFNMNTSPTRRLEYVELIGYVGQQIDFANSRPGTGGSIALATRVRPTDHLELRLNGERRWLDVRGDAGGAKARLFTALVGRLRGTYTFTSRMFVRAIGQYVETRRDPSLYLGDPPDARSGSLTSSLLFAYKLNWQTVLFVGFGDGRTLTEQGDLERSDRQFFVKVSYAFQR